MRRACSTTVLWFGLNASACGGLVGASRDNPPADARIDGEGDVATAEIGADAASDDVTTTDAHPDVSVDATVPDFSIPDLGLPDVTVHDLGVADLGVRDLGVPDLGAPDLGAPDMGVSSQVLRLANLAFGTAKIDLCAVPGTTSDFSTARPLLYTATGGALDGLAYGQFSSYFPALPVATIYSVRAIAGGTTAATVATACQTKALGPTVQTSFSIVTGSENTFAAYGATVASASPTGIATLQDSTGRPGDGTIMLRLFDGAANVPLIDTGYSAGGVWVVGTTGTPYGSTHIDTVDTGLGLTLLPGAQYVGGIPLIGSVEIGVFAHGMLGADGGVPVVTGMENYDAAATRSLYVVPQTSTQLQIIDCDDTQPISMTATSLFSPCAALAAP